eukprot:m.18596 g.18596  ORF g.18596 m.18596 type:complete len:51 (-) comp4984_c0_seq1:38-190(-)
MPSHPQPPTALSSLSSSSSLFVFVSNQQQFHLGHLLPKTILFQGMQLIFH